MKNHIFFWISFVTALIDVFGAIFWFERNEELFKLFIIALGCSFVGLIVNYIALEQDSK